MQYSQYKVSFLVQPDRLWTVSCKNSVAQIQHGYFVRSMSKWTCKVTFALRVIQSTWRLTQPNEWHWLTSEYCYIHSCDNLHIEVLKCISKLNRLFSSDRVRERVVIAPVKLNDCFLVQETWLTLKVGLRGKNLHLISISQSMRWCTVVVQILGLDTLDHFQTVCWK